MESTPPKKTTGQAQTGETIDVATVGRIPMNRALEIYRSISQALGGLTRLDKKSRVARAKKAAAARWDPKK